MASSLTRATPESQGVPSLALRKLVQKLGEQEIHSLMVLRHGKVIFEGWWEPFSADAVHQLFSLSKSFTSTAIGLAADEKLLSLDDRVISFFPDQLPATQSENLRAMRIRDLLTMACGHQVEVYTSLDFDPKNLVRSFLHHPVPFAPGQVFLYNSFATYMCSAILQKRAGKTLTQYLESRLFEPLDIKAHPWEQDGSGVDFGGWGLSLKTEDIAKFGQLLLQNGKWNGKQILPKTWVGQASARQVENGDRGANDWAQGYGFQFWRCQPGCFRGDGAFGQLCVVSSDHDLVVVATAAVDDIQAMLTAIWQELLPAISPGSLPASPESDQLRTLAKTLTVPVLPGDQILGSASRWSGKYKTVSPANATKSLNLEFANGSIHIEMSGPEPWDILAGQGQWLKGSNGKEPVVGCFRWINADEVECKLRWLEKTRGETWILKLAGSKLTIKRAIRCTIPVLGGETAQDFEAVRD